MTNHMLGDAHDLQKCCDAGNQAGDEGIVTQPSSFSMANLIMNATNSPFNHAITTLH